MLSAFKSKKLVIESRRKKQRTEHGSALSRKIKELIVAIEKKIRHNAIEGEFHTSFEVAYPWDQYRKEVEKGYQLLQVSVLMVKKKLIRSGYAVKVRENESAGKFIFEISCKEPLRFRQDNSIASYRRAA